MTKRRLLVVSPLDIFPPNTGGMSRTYNIIKSLLPRYDVALACPTLSRPEAQDLPVRVHQLARPGKAQFVSPLFVKKLRTVIKRESPDVILTNFVWTVPAVWIARVPGKTPIYLDTHNVETERLRGAGAGWWRLAAMFERLATHLADRVIVVSEEDRNLLRRLGMPDGKGFLLPNGYDEETFFADPEAGRAMRQSLGIADHELMLLYFGHMGYGPNREALQPLYRDVLPAFERQGVEYRLVVAGRHSEELGKEYDHPRVLFAGVVDRIQDAINAADVVVVPLLRGGGTRLKIIESVACGTPVVSTTAGAAGLQREAFGELLTVVDGWEKFACAMTVAARRPRDERVAPAGFREQYAWREIVRPLELDGAMRTSHDRAGARVGPLPKLGRAFGYMSSLRPYSVSALSSRALRHGTRLVRRLPGGRRVLPVSRNGLHADGTAQTCPTVDAGAMKAGLESLGIAVERFEIDRPAFEAFLRDARFPPWYYPHEGAPSAAFLEKTLEHYVASSLLDLAAADVYVDVGADNSPFSRIAERLFRCRAYQLDAAYRRGVHGRYLGCDVRRIALPDSSVDKMAAHCAFDHFQGDADRAFLSEAARVLRPGGRLCVLPLYLSEVTTNYVDPSAWLAPPQLDHGARIIDVTGWGYEFSRYYAPEAFVAFAAGQSATLSLRVFEVTGAEAIDAGCYLRLAALFERK